MKLDTESSIIKIIKNEKRSSNESKVGKGV